MRRTLLICLFAAALVGCNGAFFYPQREHVRTPENIGLTYEDVRFASADGVNLHGWFLPARGPACATILFLHGNAENISTHIGSVFWLPARGFNVFMPDYRGYGESEGKPSVGGIQQDIEAALRYLLQRPDIDTSRLVVFGESLGAASAIYYVAHSQHREHIRALVAESSFSSHRDITREKLANFWLTWPLQYPLAWTVDDDYRPIAAVRDIAPIPLLLIHGDRDDIIPDEHSGRLFAAAQEPKQLWIVPGAGHIQGLVKQDMRERFVSYLRERVCPR